MNAWQPFMRFGMYFPERSPSDLEAATLTNCIDQIELGNRAIHDALERG
ncbi:MAG: hypothetical protein AAGK34_08275 [Planctomycetota bacterium]